MGDLDNKNFSNEKVDSEIEANEDNGKSILSFYKKPDGLISLHLDKEIGIMDLIFLIKYLKNQTLKELIDNEFSNTG